MEFGGFFCGCNVPLLIAFRIASIVMTGSAKFALIWYEYEKCRREVQQWRARRKASRLEFAVADPPQFAGTLPLWILCLGWLASVPLEIFRAVCEEYELLKDLILLAAELGSAYMPQQQQQQQDRALDEGLSLDTLPPAPTTTTDCGNGAVLRQRIPSGS